MEQKSIFVLILVTYITLLSLESAMARSHVKYHHHYHTHHRNHPVDSSGENQERSQPKHAKLTTSSTPSSWRPSDDDYEYEEEEEGRHAYVMTTKGNRKTSAERVTEDQTLTTAFEKHMKGVPNIHDVYAYQLPSDLWFVVRYSKNEDGQVEKYMNVVDSFTNYLEKLDKDVRTVSVNVKGVETVFRLTPKRKADN